MIENYPGVLIIDYMRTIRIIALLIVIAAAALPAMAVGKDLNDQVPLNDKLSWTSNIYALVFAIGIAVVGFKHAKRTHLD